MSLVGWMLRRTLGNRSEPITVGLFLRDQEVNVPGYTRIPVDRWQLTERSASALIAFGPFSAPVSYDRYVLFSAGEAVEQIPESSPVTFAQGMTWEWKPELLFG